MISEATSELTQDEVTDDENNHQRKKGSNQSQPIKEDALVEPQRLIQKDIDFSGSGAHVKPSIFNMKEYFRNHKYDF